MCQGDVLSIAIKKLDAKQGFQRADLLAEGWLADMNLLCGLPEMERFGERHKVAEVVQFNHDKFILLQTSQNVLDIINILFYIDIVN